MRSHRSKTYVIMGDPVALARARHSRATGHVYDSQRHIKLVWGIDLSRIHNEEPYFIGPLQMEVSFYLPIPTSYSANRKEKVRGQFHAIRPDLDNLIKFVCDVANKICYYDDCVISRVIMQKVYDDGQGPRTEFSLSELIKPRDLS